jgi:hypothetical protein
MIAGNLEGACLESEAPPPSYLAILTFDDQPQIEQIMSLGDVQQELFYYTNNPEGALIPRNSELRGWKIAARVEIYGETRSLTITVLEPEATKAPIHFFIRRKAASLFYHVDEWSFVNASVEV